ncbi:MAG TPA: hypothetical protein VIH57_16425 [Bacteroidales bacterium]
MKKLKNFRYLLLLLVFKTMQASSSPADTITLNWLENVPLTNSGVSWGVPWPKNTVKKDQTFILENADGKVLPLQTWTLAYWPDGSIKWSGFATVAGVMDKGPFKLIRGKSTPLSGSVKVNETNDMVEINTGVLTCYLPKKGSFLIDSMIIDHRTVASKGRLICTLEDRSDLDKDRTLRYVDFTSSIKKVTIEQSGPVRAVVKIEGMHKANLGSREWLPFYVRLYFYAGEKQVRMVHSIVFDGGEKKDFISGLGVAFSVPMREEIQNRHVRFSGDGNGLWSEPIEPLIGRDRRYVAYPDSGDVYKDQIAGKRVPNKKDVDKMSQHLMETWAVWNDFKLDQPNADGFTIVKRTNAQSCWLPIGAGHGKRSSGFVFAGDVSGGLAIGIKNFWQSYPASLEVKHAAAKEAELVAWLWSPDAPAMDLRHYDTIAHGLDEVYEDVQPGFSTPNGVARTSELMLFPNDGVPTKIETVNEANTSSKPPLLVCTPQYLHAAKAFGIWSLPDPSTPFKKQVEDNLNGAIAYYEKSVEQNHWYGFWDFGDVMHSYDDVRHEWRYDLGGMAWDNSELGTDMWLWYSFLRTGRPDIFRMAEAMTRHTSEVDCYHLGRFAGLGSRHNVRHWGCGAKEARISQAAYRRFYYYLTTDERIGDVMHEMVNADYKATEYDPMRLAQPETEAEKKYPGRVRGGPDWLAFAGNWMTEWERTGNTKYRDKILTGMKSILNMHYWFKTGQNLVFGYDPVTGKLYQLDDEAADYNLATIMGGAEVMFELNDLIDYPEWQKAWLQYCRLTNAPADVLLKDKITGNEGSDGSYARPDRLAAYAYMKTKNPAFAKKAYARIAGRPGMYDTKTIEAPEVLNPIEEAARVGTNGTAQSSLIAIKVLEMCADQLPDSVPKFEMQGLPRSIQSRGDRRTPSNPGRRVN